MKTNSEIHITTDGKTTYAVLKQDGRIVSRSEAKCHPDDQFDFETGAKIAFDRLEMNRVLSDKNQILKVGDIVECTDKYLCKSGPMYPTKGTQGKIVDIITIDKKPYTVLVRWAKGSTIGDGIWWIVPNCIKKVEQPKDSFKVGDIVEFIENPSKSIFPPKGTRGKIVQLSEETHLTERCALVQWAKGSIDGDGKYWVLLKRIKKVETK